MTRTSDEGSANDATARAAFNYDGRLLDQMNRIQDRIERYALQNYAAAGAVFVAYFTGSIPIHAAAAAVIVLGLNFIIAIGVNIYGLRVLWKMHRIALDRWFEEKTELREALIKGNDDINKLLATKSLSLTHFLPVIIANLLPAIAILIWWKYFV
jgi:hypothetical protein